ncbi:MAG: 2-phospho-L-lactate/phosphoenolpyruvate guanylyltransferase [Thermoleophilaceae bacterium]|jgi:2-phospho-L-lactate guanylyltransferase|nr:2-phospho-L-lactate/phosphoenolpyruvate guanylyltransferase [Thermoleophilaceae bacterium]
MRTLAIVPIKSFDLAKQRLSDSLAVGGRRSLVQAMFSDVLGALRHTEGIERIAVVTADVAAGSVATGERMVVLHDGVSAGQSAATEIGIRYALDQGFERVLLVPGDTPLLKPPDLDKMLARCEHDGIAVAIVPDRHGTGTNGLLIVPPDAFAPSFGEGSLERHLTQARERELVHRVEALPSLEHDVDTPSDLAALWDVIDGSRRGAQRTRGALMQLDRSGARAAIVGAAVEA